MLQKIQETADFLRQRMPTQPKIGIILGTGLGNLVTELTDKAEIAYENIPNFPVSTVEGHSGKLLVGKLGGVDVLAMQGRFHYYEGYDMKQVTFPVRVMKALKKAGQTTEMAVAQIEASKLAVDASLLSLQQQIIEMENSISSLLGDVPRQITRSTLDVQSFPDTLSIGVPLQLLQRRPDVRQSEAALAAACYVTNQAYAAFYPSITLSGSAGWTNAAGAVISNPGEWLFSAIGSLVQPLFNRGQNIANLKVAKAQQEEALLSFRQSLLDAGNEVNNALLQWQTARQRLELDKQQIASLGSAVRSSELLMKHSSQNYLEVLTARQTLLEAELSAVSDRFDEIQGVINLYHALGGGY